MTTQVQESPSGVQLAEPGAGLPRPELWIARLRFGLISKTKSQEEFSALFEKERDGVLKIAREFDPREGSKQVLIKRLRGMEDSSRNWSAFMTLEHLNIVNLAILEIIKTLMHDDAGSLRTVSTADVKPSATTGIEVVDAFERTCNLYSGQVAKLSNLDSDETHPHPWFGPLTAAKWHGLVAFHMGIHRKQLERIRDSLGKR